MKTNSKIFRYNEFIGFPNFYQFISQLDSNTLSFAEIDDQPFINWTKHGFMCDMPYASGFTDF